jgi:hypothetical protein
MPVLKMFLVFEPSASTTLTQSLHKDTFFIILMSPCRTSKLSLFKRFIPYIYVSSILGMCTVHRNLLYLPALQLHWARHCHLSSVRIFLRACPLPWNVCSLNVTDLISWRLLTSDEILVFCSEGFASLHSGTESDAPHVKLGQPETC